MEKALFLSKLNYVLGEERKKILAGELENDFSILRRQREGESVPPKHYWALKSLPRSFQVQYIKCLEENNSVDCKRIKETVFLRKQQIAKLVLVEWAEHPSIDIPHEQIKKWHAAAVDFDKRTGFYKHQLESLCKKNIVKRVFRNCYFEMTGRKMRTTADDLVFADDCPVTIGDARILVEWDCGGWSHFREEIGVEWQGKLLMRKQSIASWLGYYPIGVEGWNWILQDDLEQAAKDAVAQTNQFRDILVSCIHKCYELF